MAWRAQRSWYLWATVDFIYSYSVNGSELQTSNIAAKTCPTAHESMASMCTRCPLYAHVENVLICAFHFHLFFLYFFLSVLFCLPFLSPVVCENREEPWSWFQYLWRNQWPGEPLQTLWYGTTRPSLPASHSLPGFSSELPWKLLLITAVFCQSVLMRVRLWGSSWLG